ncbi:MAG: hypothetical protein N2111_00825 [Candidatus Sumerlaeaceae bacterium]|nr:hypothetical protein [Candidatus Sumerlaeaceae bacterium]
MKLSQAVMLSLLCLSVAGCSGLNRSRAVAPGAPAAAGPDAMAAPPPRTPASSTISVAPGNMYNLGPAPNRSKTGPQSSATKKKTSTPERDTAQAAARKEPKTEPSSAPAQPLEVSATSAGSQSASNAADSTVPQPSAASASGGMSSPAGDPLAVDDLPMPVRPGAAPQSSAPAPAGKAATAPKSQREVVPVSAPPATTEEKLDSKFSS